MEQLLEDERAALARWCHDYHCGGGSNGQWKEPASAEEMGLATNK
jgi:hypothetical protein